MHACMYLCMYEFIKYKIYIEMIAVHCIVHERCSNLFQIVYSWGRTILLVTYKQMIYDITYLSRVMMTYLSIWPSAYQDSLPSIYMTPYLIKTWSLEHMAQPLFYSMSCLQTFGSELNFEYLPVPEHFCYAPREYHHRQWCEDLSFF